MVLVFDVSADLALFRKPYTTTSMVSFAFPPPTAIAGLLGAIVGIDHGSSIQASSAAIWDAMQGVQVAVGLRNPIEWMVTAVNLMKLKTPNADMGEHIQIKHQFVKRPCYRIYVRGGDDFPKLKEKLANGEFIFTPYLGTAYNLADVSFVGELAEDAVDEVGVVLNTVVPAYAGVEVDVLATGSVHRETVPYRFNRLRRLQETVTVFFPDFGRQVKTVPKIHLRNKGCLAVSQVGSERVAWFNAW